MTAALDSPTPPAATTPPALPGRSRARLRVGAALLGCGVLAVLLLLVPGTVNVLDGQSMLAVTRSIVERGDVTVPGPPLGVPGLHGHWYSKYGPGQSLLAVPLYLAGQVAAGLVPPNFRPELPAMAASLLPALATALAAALLVPAAVELGASMRGALALALIYALATPAAVYAMQWFSEPPVACAVLAAFYLLLRDRARPTVWRPLCAGAALAVAVATRLDALFLAAPLLLYALLPAGRRLERAAALALPLGAALVGLGLYDAARFGSPFATGYDEGDVYAYRDTHAFRGLASLGEGVYGLLVSPGKGLLEYAPPVILAPLGAVALWARRRAETLVLLALVVLALVAHADVLIRWVGGWSWGPRFLVPVLPFALLLLAPLLGPRPLPPEGEGVAGGAAIPASSPGVGRRPIRSVLAGLVLLGVLGVLVQVPALAVDEPASYIYTLQPRYYTAGHTLSVAAITRLEWDYINRPDLSPIVGSWRLLGRAGTWTPPSDVAPALVARKSVTVAPHTWWRLLALQGVPAAPLVVACALLGALAFMCLGRAFLSLPSAE